jgi:hypothetical protein
LDGIEPVGVVTLQEGAPQVNQIKLVFSPVQGILCPCPESRKGQQRYEQVCQYMSVHRVSVVSGFKL